MKHWTTVDLLRVLRELIGIGRTHEAWKIVERTIIAYYDGPIRACMINFYFTQHTRTYICILQRLCSGFRNMEPKMYSHFPYSVLHFKRVTAL